MQTEEQAKTKWCPFSRSVWEGDNTLTSANRDSSGNYYDCDKCLGSACMAWRGASQLIDGANVPNDGNQYGYCGLAGKPF